MPFGAYVSGIPATLVSGEGRDSGRLGIEAPEGRDNAGDRGLAALPSREREFRDTFDHALAYAETCANG